MMNENKAILQPDQMRAIARYEVTFTDIIPLPDDYDDIEDFVDVQCRYLFTLEDLYIALKNLAEKNPTIKDFGEGWYYPLSHLEEAFGIDAACGDDSDVIYDEDVAPDCVRGLPFTREDIFARIWCEFEDDWTLQEDEDRISDVPAFRRYLQEIELYHAECNKPLDERTFTDQQKKDFISYFESDNRISHASEMELQLCRQFTEELCEKGSKTALHLKGYACYGGNRLYPCDWPASRDCMIRLYEKTDNPQYANTLGYIYYYGRCTDGEPEYEKAYEMFSIAAANGLYEGLYKLADMYLHGYACKKSPKTARNLYGMVYEDCRKKFLNGQDNSFADAAIRMGNVFLKGINEDVNPEAAYSYFLQADFAHRRRIEHSDFFGNTTVAINIRKSLDETKSLLEEDFFKEYTEEKQPWLMYSLLEDNNRIALIVEKTDDTSACIRAKRVPVKTGKSVRPILVTIPELDWCELTTEVTIEAINIKTTFNSEEDGPSLVDYVEWNWAEQRLDFYCTDNLIGWISCDAYRLYGPKKAAPSGNLIRIATVRFQPNGRSYDYLCEDESVHKGDTVIVPGYSGETAVEVIKIYSQYESELGLPLKRYKKVIRKDTH